MKFPTQIYVTFQRPESLDADDIGYFMVHTEAAAAAEVGQNIEAGIYELKEKVLISCEVKVKK